MAESNEVSKLLKAISFAARSHRHQLRKDKETPYVSHVFRVCLILRDVFGIADRRAMTAAVLHDTIEDTNVDFDDLADEFDKEIAQWVSLLSKDKRRDEDAREAEYCERLRQAPWQVQACKLADMFDNLMDLANLAPDRRGNTVRRVQKYFDVLEKSSAKEITHALQIVQELLKEKARET